MSPPSRDVARFRALPEAEGRLLFLIDAFSRKTTGPRELEGRVKLAKLDFLVRYPKYLSRVLRWRNVPEAAVAAIEDDESPIEERMIRYRYGPWDPAYYAILGSLIGRGLVETVPAPNGIGYRTTDKGRTLIEILSTDGVWDEIRARARLTRQHLDKTGTTLKNWLYEAIPEMTHADWREELS